jgi:DNA modification methylase
MFQHYFKKIHAPEQGGTTPRVEPIEEFINKVIHGDCTKVMQQMPSGSVDLVVTDPPYLVNYTSRDGRNYENDDPNNAWWVKPAFREIYRILKPGSFCLSFYGFTQVEKFMLAWKSAGFRPVGHFVFIKNYASSEHFTKMHHENAYLLAKSHPPLQVIPPVDVREWHYSGNKLHPSEKSADMLAELIQAYSKPNDIILDPFCGSGSTLLAAKALGRRYIGIELDEQHAETARKQVGTW